MIAYRDRLAMEYKLYMVVGQDEETLAAKNTFPDKLKANPGMSAEEQGIAQVVAPLRPTWKHRYPLATMADYATWVREDGLSIDPWIRTHQRMGATVLGPATRSMVISGTVAEWESWADMVFPVSGRYVVPDALNTITVDRDADRATYVEENLWVRHR